MAKYIDLADMSPEQAQAHIDKFKTRHDIIAYQMQKEMGRRNASHNKQKNHPTQNITVQGENVDIDIDMIPIILWLNNLPSTFTTFCCQGDIDSNNDGKHKQPYVFWLCNTPTVVEYVLKKFAAFHWHSATLTHSYHEVKTEVDFFQNGIRYTSKWYDNLALKDFITWAGLTCPESGNIE